MSVVFMPVLVIHVVVAVLGLGSVLSIAVVATTARRAGTGSIGVLSGVGPLLRFSAYSLAAMLATGILMDLATGGAMSRWWWFRGSALLLVATGILHAQARRAVRRGLAAPGGDETVLRRLERMAYGMCALIAMITVLMEAKPF